MHLLIFLFESFLDLRFELVGHVGVLDLDQHVDGAFRQAWDGRVGNAEELDVVGALQEGHLWKTNKKNVLQFHSSKQAKSIYHSNAD